jgi:hypothetical protein
MNDEQLSFFGAGSVLDMYHAEQYANDKNEVDWESLDNKWLGEYLQFRFPELKFKQIGFNDGWRSTNHKQIRVEFYFSKMSDEQFTRINTPEKIWDSPNHLSLNYNEKLGGHGYAVDNYKKAIDGIDKYCQECKDKILEEKAAAAEKATGKADPDTEDPIVRVLVEHDDIDDATEVLEEAMIRFDFDEGGRYMIHSSDIDEAEDALDGCCLHYEII